MTQYEDYDPYEMNELRFHDGCLISRYRNLSWTLLDLTQQVVNGLIIAVREQDAAREQRLAALLTKAMWVHDLVERRLSRLIRAEDKRRWHEKREARRAVTGTASESEGAADSGEAVGASAQQSAFQPDESCPPAPVTAPKRAVGETPGRAAPAPAQDDAGLEAILDSVMASLDQTERGAAAHNALAPP